MTKVQNSDAEFKVEFGIYEVNIRNAGEAFRAATRIIKSLKMSLIGETPGCAEELGIDTEEHARLWNFQDEMELVDFINYLDVLVVRANELTPDHVPSCESGVDSIIYKTSKRTAELAFFQKEECWRVVGEVTVLSRYTAYAICNKLKKKGFFVELTGI